jgi:hypothetical protein
VPRGPAAKFSWGPAHWQLAARRSAHRCRLAARWAPTRPISVIDVHACRPFGKRPLALPSLESPNISSACSASSSLQRVIRCISARVGDSQGRWTKYPLDCKASPFTCFFTIPDFFVIRTPRSSERGYIHHLYALGLKRLGRRSLSKDSFRLARSLRFLNFFLPTSAFRAGRFPFSHSLQRILSILILNSILQLH